MSDVERRLAFRDIRNVLAKLSGSRIVLVGGQAVNFWADQFLSRVERRRCVSNQYPDR